MDDVDLRADPAWWCAVHCRGLGYWEWKQGGCFWCDPSLSPPTPPTVLALDDKNPVHKRWAERQKVWQSIRDLTPDQRQALIPPRVQPMPKPH